jgi:hypothetical protein
LGKPPTIMILYVGKATVWGLNGSKLKKQAFSRN